MSPLIQLIISQIPVIVATIKEARAANDPLAPVLTSEEIIMAFDQLFADSVAKDQLLMVALQAEIDAAGGR